MELFNEFYSSEMQFLMDLFCLNRAFTKDEFTNIAKASNVFAPYDDYGLLLKKWTSFDLLEKVSENIYRVCSDTGLASFAAPPNELEMEYLSNIVNTDEAGLFIDDVVKNKLPHSNDTPYEFVLRQNSVGKRNEIRIVNKTVFRLLLKAIYEKRRIECTYCTNNDFSMRKSVVIPYRIEYSVFDGRWWLISYNENQNRTIKSRVENIKNVELKELHFIEERKMRAAVLRHLSTEPVILRIDNKKNGLERCFLAFENMLDMTALDLGNDQYQLGFRYFDWDSHVVVRKLLYLGETVTVLSPKVIVDELVCELKMALKIQ